ncbi:MAG TPA: hypothetical protein VD883_04200 [Candidatus Omnitrophota bacterium]|nr:hypothetical protein [Candidatus Omnitrophota bacterium]
MKKTTQGKLRELVQAIRLAKKIVVLCSKDPGADTIAGMLTLGHAMNSLGKDVTLISPDGVPSKLQVLPGSELIYSERNEIGDLAVWLDRGADGKLGAAQMNFEKSKIRIKLSPEDCGCSMTLGELVLPLIRALGVDIDHALAVCLDSALENSTV